MSRGGSTVPNLLLNKDDVDIVIEKSVPGLENSAISELACSKLQIPDLYLKAKGEYYPQMVMEICSSPYEDTIRKCIWFNGFAPDEDHA